MIYLLYGSDTFSSRRKLRELIGAFRERSGGNGLTQIDAAENTEALFAAGRTASLFAERELLVIENVSLAPMAASEYVRRELDRWAHGKALTVIFWERSEEKSKVKAGSAGKGTLLTAIKAKAAKSQEFAKPSLAGIKKWLDAECANRRIRLPADEKKSLIDNFSGDLWAISNELGKMEHGWALARSLPASAAIWDFTDAFIQHRRRSFLPLMRLIAEGTEPVFLLSSLGGALRTLILVWKGIASGKVRTLTSRLHPFVVRKNSVLAAKLDPASIRGKFCEVLDADTDLKTGRLPHFIALIKLVLR